MWAGGVWDGTSIVTASKDGTARLWDAASGKPLCPLLQHQDEVLHAALSPDGRRVVTASKDKNARVWDAISGESLEQPLRHEYRVVHAAFSADGQRIITTSQSAWVWETATARPDPPVHMSGVNYSALSADGRWLVTAGRDHTARLWSTKGPRDGPLLQHNGEVLHAAFSPDGRRERVELFIPVCEAVQHTRRL